MKIAYLEKSIPEENQYRYYSIYIARTLFGHWALVREWGRLGSKGGQRREEWYEKETEALEAGLKYMQAKKKRGYAISRVASKTVLHKSVSIFNTKKHHLESLFVYKKTSK